MAAGVFGSVKLAGVLFALGFLAEAVIGGALFDEELRIFAIVRSALGLNVGADGTADIGALIVGHANSGERALDDVDCAFDLTSLVCVLDAEDERAAGVAGYEILIERGAKIADMHMSRGRRCKAGADAGVRNPRFIFLKKVHKNDLQ